MRVPAAGRWVVRDLRSRGHDVLNVDATHDGSPHGQCRVADLTDLGQCHEVVAGADAVVHLAAIPAPEMRTSGETFRNNAISTYNVFSAASERGVPPAAQGRRTVDAVTHHWGRATPFDRRGGDVDVAAVLD